jgi:DNA-binding FadR family transcriptional regulator
VIPRNPIFTSLHDAVVEWLTEQRKTSGRAPAAARAAYAAHERIFRAIAAHDEAAAQQGMQLHLDQVVKFYWKIKNAADGGT